MPGVEIQEFLHDDEYASEKWKTRLRIGIHIGDVVRQKGDILGDAVKNASRIQLLTNPEGVCVSEQVYYRIRNKLAYHFELLDNPPAKKCQISLQCLQDRHARAEEE